MDCLNIRKHFKLFSCQQKSNKHFKKIFFQSVKLKDKDYYIIIYKTFWIS